MLKTEPSDKHWFFYFGFFTVHVNELIYKDKLDSTTTTTCNSLNFIFITISYTEGPENLQMVLIKAHFFLLDLFTEKHKVFLSFLTINYTFLGFGRLVRQSKGLGLTYAK